MAYRRSAGSRSRSARGRRSYGGARRGRSASRGSRGVSRRSGQTIRIVIEQPPTGGAQRPGMEPQPPRKATF